MRGSAEAAAYHCEERDKVLNLIKKFRNKHALTHHRESVAGRPVEEILKGAAKQ